ncbi:MAG TPA: LolA-related protein [Burkholderiaceae bacterium]|nr:LolA-related protein [Burkholderiaceae bacterium]
MSNLVKRRALLSAMLACVARPALSQGVDDPLLRLFAELGAHSERRARFSERKFSALLKAPVESSGTLIFRAPGYLEKRTVEPHRETVKIEGNVVSYESAAVRGAAQKRTFAVSEAPLLAALIESLRATLGGDLPALRRHYNVSFSAANAQKEWQLTLVPRERALLDAVSKVVLRGAGSEVNAIEIVEANGDLTLMQISAVQIPSAPIKK